MTLRQPRALLVTLALGDAIMVALASEVKGFTPEDFAKSHPGGKLGKRLNIADKGFDGAK